MRQSVNKLLASSLMLLPAYVHGDEVRPLPTDHPAAAEKHDDGIKPGQIAENPRQLIVGQWEVPEGPMKGMFFEFKKDGTVNFTKDGPKPPMPNETNPAKLLNAATIYRYKFVNDSTIQLDAMVPAALAALSGGHIPTAEESKKLKELTKKGAMTCVKSDKANIVLSKDALTLQGTGESDQVIKFKRIK